MTILYSISHCPISLSLSLSLETDRKTALRVQNHPNKLSREIWHCIDIEMGTGTSAGVGWIMGKEQFVWGHPLVWSETRFMLALKIYTGLGLSNWNSVWNSGKRHLIPKKEKCFRTKYNGDVRDVCVLWMKYVHAATVLPAEMSCY